MRKTKYILLVLLIFSCQNSEKSLLYKNTIEYSIKSTSKELNILIDELNKWTVGIDNQNLIKSLIDKSHKNIVARIELINKLVETDKELQLKNQTLIYLKECDKFLLNFFKPILNYQSLEDISKDKIVHKRMYKSLNKILKITEFTDDLLDGFCTKHNLEKGMLDFDIKKYEKDIQEFDYLLE